MPISSHTILHENKAKSARPSSDSQTVEAKLQTLLKQLEATPCLRKTPDLSAVLYVLQKLPNKNPRTRVISIVGTNGKGSSVAILQTIAMAAGLRVGSFTSPHLRYYNQRICIQGKPVSNANLLDALLTIKQLSDQRQLTYFEYSFLAAWLLFNDSKYNTPLDLVILEAGIGAQHDCTNCIDADYSLFTSIDYDHCQLLGKSLTAIATNKACIMRPQQTAVVSQDIKLAHVQTIAAIAKKLHASALIKSRDYQIRSSSPISSDSHNSLQNIIIHGTQRDLQLQIPSHQPAELAAACVVLSEASGLSQQLSPSQLSQCLQNIALEGRCQQIQLPPYDIWLDVAHNPHAFRHLIDTLKQLPDFTTKQHIFYLGIYADKDIRSILELIQPACDQLYIIQMDSHRAANAPSLQRISQQLGFLKVSTINQQQFLLKIKNWSSAKKNQPTHLADTEKQRQVICGSFYLVGHSLNILLK